MKHCLDMFLYMAMRQCYEEEEVKNQGCIEGKPLVFTRRMDRVQNARIRELCEVT